MKWHVIDPKGMRYYEKRDGSRVWHLTRKQALELSACFAAERLQTFLKATEQTMETLSMNANTRLTMFRYLDLLLKK